MTKKDYELIASQFSLELELWRSNIGPVFGTEAVKAIELLAKRMSDRLKRDNPKFDSERFLNACGLEA